MPTNREALILMRKGFGEILFCACGVVEREYIDGPSIKW